MWVHNKYFNFFNNFFNNNFFWFSRHIGDGSVHAAVGTQNKDELKLLIKKLDPFIIKTMKEVKGSISSEHGIG